MKATHKRKPWGRALGGFFLYTFLATAVTALAVLLFALATDFLNGTSHHKDYPWEVYGAGVLGLGALVATVVLTRKNHRDHLEEVRAHSEDYLGLY